MTARDDILKALRSAKVPRAELPAPDGPWIEYEDPRRQFAETLQLVGGVCLEAANFDQARQRLEEMAPWRDAKKICSCVPQVAAGNVDLQAVNDPHELEDVDFAVLPGKFAVAENGAVWTTDEGLKHRVLGFLTQHLALIVPASQIVHNMHQAYQRLRFEAPGFGVFISGPSKTADIEQSLVIGAHGARSLAVVLVESE